MKTWIVAAVEAELGLLRNELGARTAEVVGGEVVFSGSLGAAPLWLGVIGVGAVSAAFSLGCFISTLGADRVIMVGSGGALPGSGLDVGDVAIATSEIMAELGVCSGPGLGEASPLALQGLRQEIHFDPALTEALEHSASGGFRVRMGRFLTVLGVSANLEQAEGRANRFPALVESMEGFSLALAAQRCGVRAAEVRGVSNLAGTRDKTRWNLELANERAQQAVLTYLRRQS